MTRSPGWYEAQDRPGEHRWWNGAVWSVQTCGEIQARPSPPTPLEAQERDGLGRTPAMAWHDSLMAWREGRGPHPNAARDALGNPVPDLRDAPGYDPRRRPYEALVVRYLADHDVGLRVPVGVLVVAMDLAFVGARFLRSRDRIVPAFPGAAPTALQKMAEAFDDGCSAWCDWDSGVATALARPSVRELFASVVEESNERFSAGEDVLTGISGDLAHTLEALFLLHVADERMTLNRSLGYYTRSAGFERGLAIGGNAYGLVQDAGYGELIGDGLLEAARDADHPTKRRSWAGRPSCSPPCRAAPFGEK